MVTSMAHACAAGLLLWACSSAPQQDETSSYACQAPPSDLVTCSIDADCATVAIGCYCDTQPVIGVARRYATTAQTCEDAAASSCALGCANQPGVVAQDGTKADSAATIAARCDHSTSMTGICRSYVPSVPSGPGDPPSGW
jgi:hypothetical protein